MRGGVHLCTWQPIVLYRGGKGWGVEVGGRKRDGGSVLKIPQVEVGVHGALFALMYASPSLVIWKQGDCMCEVACVRGWAR